MTTFARPAFCRGEQRDGIAQTVLTLRNTIDLGHQERGLMDVEAAVLLVRIDDLSILGISELHRLVDAIFIITRPSIMNTCRSGVRECSSRRRRAIGVARTSSCQRAPWTRWRRLALDIGAARQRRRRSSPVAAPGPASSRLRFETGRSAWRILLAGRSRSHSSTRWPGPSSNSLTLRGCDGGCPSGRENVKRHTLNAELDEQRGADMADGRTAFVRLDCRLGIDLAIDPEMTSFSSPSSTCLMRKAFPQAAQDGEEALHTIDDEANPDIPPIICLATTPWACGW